MADISNKTLALFLLIATVVSLGGFILSFSRMENLGITGRAASDTGTSNFTINSSISVVFTADTVDFGVGNVNTSGTGVNCTLNTTGPGMLNGVAAFLGLNCSGFSTSVQPLRIQNQGTLNVSLNISFNVSGATLIGGTNPEFGIKVTQNETGACGGANLNSSYINATTAGVNHTICMNTGFNWNTVRTLNIDIGMRIPQDASPGAHPMRVTANAYT